MEDNHSEIILLPTGIHFLVQVGMMKDLLKLCFKGFFHREMLWPKGLVSTPLSFHIASI